MEKMNKKDRKMAYNQKFMCQSYNRRNLGSYRMQNTHTKRELREEINIK